MDVAGLFSDESYRPEVFCCSGLPYIVTVRETPIQDDFRLWINPSELYCTHSTLVSHGMVIPVYSIFSLDGTPSKRVPKIILLGDY